METIPNHTDSCPKTRRWSPKSYNPTEDRYIAIVAKRNRRMSSTRVTSMVTASIGKAISAATVRRRLHMNGQYAGGTSSLCSSIRPIKRGTTKVVSGTWQSDCV
ncbi:HTH_Tnp_Tc3_2 domain-containing protein [Trichonephila clavipes]|nr:HTH_Tnp_Tc3_2 domain-containing protein [Trichonephila clavipes]